MTTETETTASPFGALPSVSRPGRVPIKSWAPELEGSALEQATNLSNLPFAHPPRRAHARRPRRLRHADRWRAVRRQGRRAVRHRRGHRLRRRARRDRPDRRDAVSRPSSTRRSREIAAGVPVGMRRPAEAGRPRGRAGRDRDARSRSRSSRRGSIGRVNQLGTLGSGNHFLEVQRDEDGRVFVMLHSGSRSLGKTICDAFHKRALAREQAVALGAAAPGAGLPAGGTPTASIGYWAAMTFALRFAEVNRSRMLDGVEVAFGAHTRDRAVRSARRRPPQLRGLGEPLRRRTGSSTARAPCAPAPARRC